MPAPRDGEGMVTTTQAARLLGCSRANVAQLVERGHLKGAIASGAECRIPRSSVTRYRKQLRSGSADSKAGAQEAGMYSIPEQVYVEHIAKRRAHVAAKEEYALQRSDAVTGTLTSCMWRRPPPRGM